VVIVALGAWLLLFPSGGHVVYSGRAVCLHVDAEPRARAETDAEPRAVVEVDAEPRAHVLVRGDSC
jgi:hypothetical protein